MTDQKDMGFEGVESRTTEKESEDNSLSSVPIETDEITTTTQVPSRDWQIGCNLNDCLLNVYTNARWTDITIRCGDKEISRPLKAHKIILAARSPVFCGDKEISRPLKAHKIILAARSPVFCGDKEISRPLKAHKIILAARSPVFCGDKEISRPLKAHKIILAARSPVFCGDKEINRPLRAHKIILAARSPVSCGDKEISRPLKAHKIILAARSPVSCGDKEISRPLKAHKIILAARSPVSCGDKEISRPLRAHKIILAARSPVSCGDKEISRPLKAHKIILAARSPVFCGDKEISRPLKAHKINLAAGSPVFCGDKEISRPLKAHKIILAARSPVSCGDKEISRPLKAHKIILAARSPVSCGDKEISRPLKAHKIILAARSPVFDAMFFGPCSESKTEYDFPDDDVDIFDKMLRFMYNDDANLTDVDEAADLMQMAHMYQITCLVDHCALFLQNNITFFSACKSLDCALKYSITSLRDACCDFIDRNVDEVIRTDGFLAVSREGLTYMLKGDTFFAKEDVIFHRVEEWAKLKLSELGKEESGKNIRDILGEAFYYLRLPTLNSKTLIKCIKRKGYFSIDEHEDIMDCNLGCLSQLSFISNVRRVPFELTFTCSKYTEHEITQCQQIVQTLKLEILNDLRLKFVEIPLFETFLKYNEKLYKDKYRDPIEGQCLPGSLNPVLSVVVTIDKVNFENHSNVHQRSNKPSTVIFKDPVLLKRRDSPFDIKIQIEPIDRDPAVMLVRPYKKDACMVMRSRCGQYSYSDSSRPMLGIKELGGVNCSFRE